jgi:hypothetical protein
MGWNDSLPKDCMKAFALIVDIQRTFELHDDLLLQTRVFRPTLASGAGILINSECRFREYNTIVWLVFSCLVDYSRLCS